MPLQQKGTMSASSESSLQEGYDRVYSLVQGLRENRNDAEMPDLDAEGTAAHCVSSYIKSDRDSGVERDALRLTDEGELERTRASRSMSIISHYVSLLPRQRSAALFSFEEPFQTDPQRNSKPIGQAAQEAIVKHGIRSILGNGLTPLGGLPAEETLLAWPPEGLVTVLGTTGTEFETDEYGRDTLSQPHRVGLTARFAGEVALDIPTGHLMHISPRAVRISNQSTPHLQLASPATRQTIVTAGQRLVLHENGQVQPVSDERSDEIDTLEQKKAIDMNPQLLIQEVFSLVADQIHWTDATPSMLRRAESQLMETCSFDLDAVWRGIVRNAQKAIDERLSTTTVTPEALGCLPVEEKLLGLCEDSRPGNNFWVRPLTIR